MRLYGQRQKRAPLARVHPAHGEDGQKIVVAARQFQMKALERCPRQHRGGEHSFRRARLGHEALQLSVAAHVLLIVREKRGVIRAVCRPEIGKRLRFRVEHRVAGRKHVVHAHFSIHHRRAQLLVAVDDGGQRMEHRGIQLQPRRAQPRHVQGYGHAVKAGHVVMVVAKKRLPRPGRAVDLRPAHIDLLVVDKLSQRLRVG